MQTPSDAYVKGIYERFKYFAAWLPNTPAELGDVGIMQDRYFKRSTSLKALGIPYQIRSGLQPIDFSYTSQASVQFQSEASSKLHIGVSNAKAEAVVKFSQEGAFVFEAMRCFVDEIENKEELGRNIIEYFQNDKWAVEWSVVDSIVRADSTTVMIANSRSAQIDFSLTANLPILTLADPKAGLMVRSQSGDLTRLIAEKGLVPLFKLSRVRNSFFKIFQRPQKKITFGGKMPTFYDKLEEYEGFWEIVTPE